MKITVEMRVHRALRHLSQFSRVAILPERIREVMADDPLVKEEQLIGIYENVPNEIDGVILITSTGMRHFRRGIWEYVPYADIKASWRPEGDKMEADTLMIETHSGNTMSWSIVGGNALVRDIFSFMTFLLRMEKDFGDGRKS